MKTRFIFPFLLLFVSANLFGQVIQTTTECDGHELHIEYDAKLSPEQIEAHIHSVKESHRNYEFRTSSGIISLFDSLDLKNSGCYNGDFETGLGYTNWWGLSLRHNNSGLPVEDGLTLLDGVVAIPNNLTLGTGDGENYIIAQNDDPTTTADDLDPNLFQATPSVNMTKLAPNTSGSRSLRLGNDYAKYGAEGIARKFVVTPENSTYYFQYAIVMDKSHSTIVQDQYGNDSTIVTNGSEAFFLAEAIDKDGASIDKVLDVANAINPFISETVNASWSFDNDGVVYYRNWVCGELDLSSHIGEEVMVYFVNSDCSASAHKGYTYLDDLCVPCKNVNEGYIDITVNTDSCMNQFPHAVTGEFALPAGGGANNMEISLDILSNGVSVSTLTNPSIVLSTDPAFPDQYEFFLDPSDFPLTDEGNCYDIVASLSFEMTDLSGQVQTVTQLSSNVVNGVQDGETPGLDNDICFCDPCALLNNVPGFDYDIIYGTTGADLTITDVSTTSAESYPYFDIDFGDGDTLTLAAGSTYEHHYTDFGTYTVCLTMYAFDGDLCCHEQICDTIVIDAPTCDDIEVDFNLFSLDCHTTVSLVTDYPTTTIAWDWGDGSPLTSGNSSFASHIHGPGTYQVTAYITFHPPWDPELCCYKTVTKTMNASCRGGGGRKVDVSGPEPTQTEVILFPNPIRTGEKMILQLNNVSAQSAQFRLTNLMGRTVAETNLDCSDRAVDVFTLPIPQNLIPGVYYYTVAMADGTRKSDKIMITR